MSSQIDPTTCRQCFKKVGQRGNSICCSTCKNWHHFRCSGLTKKEFNEHTKNVNLNWECPKCTVYRCGKCIKVITKKQSSILCDICNKWIHKKCSLLGDKDFKNLSLNNTPWFCLDCTKNNLPFVELDPKKIPKLFDIPNKKNLQTLVKGTAWCKNCSKKNHYPNSGFTCTQCNYVIHVKCTKKKIKNQLYL